MAYVITQPCINVKHAGCVEDCPVDCIYEGDDMYYINPDEYVDYGECVPASLVEAIFYHSDVPEQWARFIEKNKALFGALPPPEGQMRNGELTE